MYIRRSISILVAIMAITATMLILVTNHIQAEEDARRKEFIASVRMERFIQETSSELAVTATTKLQPTPVKLERKIESVAEIEVAMHTDVGLEISRAEIKRYSHDDLVLMTRLIQSEAIGEPYEGKLAVGAVVMNRAAGGPIKDVIYASGQFSGVGKKLFNGKLDESCMKAAEEVLSGKYKLPGATYFANLNQCSVNWDSYMKKIAKIGNHTFYSYPKFHKLVNGKLTYVDLRKLGN